MPSKNVFYQLSFDYEFKKEDEGCSIIFSYSRPYGYTDMLADLSNAQNILMKQRVGDMPRLKTVRLDIMNNKADPASEAKATDDKIRKRLSTFDM